MGLALGAGNPILHVAVTATGDRIAIAERGQERFVPLLQYLPRRAVGLGSWVIGCHRHEARKGAGAGFVLLAREGCVVGP